MGPIILKSMEELDNKEHVFIPEELKPYMGKMINVTDLFVDMVVKDRVFINISFNIQSLVSSSMVVNAEAKICTNWIKEADVNFNRKLDDYLRIYKSNPGNLIQYDENTEEPDDDNAYYEDGNSEDDSNMIEKYTEIMVTMKNHSNFKVDKEVFETDEECIPCGEYYPLELRKETAGKVIVLGIFRVYDSHDTLEQTTVQYRCDISKRFDQIELDGEFTILNWVSLFCDLIDPMLDNEIRENILPASSINKEEPKKEVKIQIKEDSVETMSRKVLFMMKNHKEANIPSEEFYSKEFAKKNRMEMEALAYVGTVMEGEILPDDTLMFESKDGREFIIPSFLYTVIEYIGKSYRGSECRTNTRKRKDHLREVNTVPSICDDDLLGDIPDFEDISMHGSDLKYFVADEFPALRSRMDFMATEQMAENMNKIKEKFQVSIVSIPIISATRSREFAEYLVIHGTKEETEKSYEIEVSPTMLPMLAVHKAKIVSIRLTDNEGKVHIIESAELVDINAEMQDELCLDDTVLDISTLLVLSPFAGFVVDKENNVFLNLTECKSVKVEVVK